MTIRAVIVDDEPLARDLIRGLARGDPEIRIVSECSNGREAVAAIRKHKPDLLFLDIQMPGLSGLDVLERVGSAVMPYVIFVTAYDRYAIRAFELQALDYLLKPFSKERFRESLERAKGAIRGRRLSGLARRMSALAGSYAEIQRSFETLDGGSHPYRTESRVRTGRTLSVVDVGDVLWIEAANQYARLHAKGGEHLLSWSLGALEGELDPRRFCRIHRSAIVNTAFVQEVSVERNGAHSILLTNGRRLRLSRGRRAVLDALMSRR